MDAQLKKPKVVLCTIPLHSYRDREEGEYPIVPKVAIVSISKWAKEAGYSSEFYDIDGLLPSDDEIAEYFKSKQPDVVGISAVVSSSYSQVKRISKIIRNACPAALIILGGYMAASANVLLRKTEVNVCALGDGEKPFCALLDCVCKCGTRPGPDELAKIGGLAFLNKDGELEITHYGEQILNNPYYLPDYDIFTNGLLGNYELMERIYFRKTKECPDFQHDQRVHEQHRKPKLTSVFTTKGCVARCAFCQRFAQGYRTVNLEALDRHLTEVKEKYNVGSILICDENFGSDKKFAYEVAELMKKHDLLWFAGGVRVTSINADDIKFFKEHGMVAIRFGVESGCQKMLNVMDKKITVNNLMAAFKATNENKLYTGLGFCLGIPGETNETIIETAKFISEVTLMRGIPPQNTFLGFPYAMPFPGTPLYQYAQLQGVIGTTVDEEERYLLYVSDIFPTKENYVNLSGSSMKDAFFWDFLAKYEAMRYYYNNIHLRQEPKMKGISTTVRSAVSTFTLKNFLRYIANPITTINAILVNSALVAKFSPKLRSLFYSLMRNLLYLEFKIKVILGFRKVFSNKKVDPYPEGKPLREVVAELFKKQPEPKTLTEKNVRFLLCGR